jgi:hypothetical protein
METGYWWESLEEKIALHSSISFRSEGIEYASIMN